MAELQLTAEQRMVVEDRGGSLLVSAAAGSGKTKVLVDRLFRYLREDHANVDDFLIITYTKAAAAELRGKIATELSRQIALTPEDGHLRNQLLRVYQADIKTVDAFCAGLLRENTHLLAREEDRRSLSPDFRTLDEDEAALLRRRVLERTLDGFYGELSEAGALLADTLGHGRDDQKLEDLVLELYGKIQSHAWPLVWLRENRAQWAAMTAEGDFDATPYAAILRGKTRSWRPSTCPPSWTWRSSWRAWRSGRTGTVSPRAWPGSISPNGDRCGTADRRRSAATSAGRPAQTNGRSSGRIWTSPAGRPWRTWRPWHLP